VTGSKRQVGRQQQASTVRTEVRVEYVSHHPEKKHCCRMMSLRPIHAV
jgi:hypothetical protein